VETTEVGVKQGTTARLAMVEGNLRAGRKATIMAESGNKVVITGTAYFEGPVDIECDFECGGMRVEGRGFGPSGNVVVKGDLLVRGDLEIDASADVRGTIAAERIDVGGHLESLGITAKGVRVGGHMKIMGPVKAEDIDVGGHTRVGGNVDIANLRVGGHAEIGGGSIKGEIKVRGHFLTSGRLDYGSIQVYGHLTLPAGSSGEALTAHGKVEFEGSALCKALQVDGVARAGGDLTTENLKVNGKLDVRGSLKVKEKLEVFGSAETKKQVECGSVTVGGRLIADRVVASGTADIGGEVWVGQGLKANNVAIRTGSRIKGPVVGEFVDVGRGLMFGGFWANVSTTHTLGKLTRVEDVHGREVRVERYSQAKRIYGETVRMQAGSMAVEVTYTKEADISEGVHLEKAPKKVDQLPEAPLRGW
jgi:cytoskeletal protein CcmA (bactofilin family)